TGPNTGGMGAYSPASGVTPEIEARVMREIVEPTLNAMAEMGAPYKGVLYAGLMLTSEGPKLIEYNNRFGDPEAQVILMRLKSDLFELLMQATAPSDAHPLDAVELHWDRRVALGVVMAAAGYPGTPRSGDIVSGLPDANHKGGDEEADPVKVFHAGTALRDGSSVTTGGRVLCVTALGDSTRQAQQHAYEAVHRISFAGAQWRSDIGQRAIRR
ncbi:MAG: phosphoribosylamine--glycine ligase, partial [Caldimonas sp.]